MCKRLIHVGAMDERYRMTARMRFDCGVVVMCLGVWVWSCVRLQFATLRTDQAAWGELLPTILLVPQYAMRSKCDRRVIVQLNRTCGCAMCDGIPLGVTSSQIRFGFLSKQINRIKGAWRQEQAQDTQDTSKIDFIPKIANSTRCRKSSSTNCSKQGGEHDKPSFAAQFTGSENEGSTSRSELPGSNLEHARCNGRDKEVTKNKRNEKEDDVAKTIKPSRRVVRKEEPAEVEAEQAAPACGASRNSNAGRILHLPSFLDLDLDFDLDISDFCLATRPHASLGLRRSSVRTSGTTRDDTCNAYNFFGHPEIGRRHCANRIRCQSGSVDAHKCYQCWANVITTTTTTALVQMT
ncbi:hypothetical protein D6C83_03859 [Aureobasidium pullulans]|uniref:Uncharacterized protein n=1 Tax=Aureobasidium pullulans TaxID=5580 RepID=A0A4T0D819_AURPU|nr:hypothetical protein D6C83_03859 [Aureobasidium pullulans]